jgi:hypothetical protein
VCEDDPRTLGERRSEALAAVAAGIFELVCECGSTGCAAAAGDARPPATALIHVVAQADTVESAHAEAAGDVGPPQPAPVGPEVDATSTVEQGRVPPALCPTPADSTQVPAALCPAPPAFVIGAGVMPAPLLAATLERATVREIVHPGDAPPEPQYRPSRALADFVRCRDLTCRWPGCDKPAYDCDVDHTVPWPVGPTHASNIKCYCRFHHQYNHSKRPISRETHISSSASLTGRVYGERNHAVVGGMGKITMTTTPEAQILTVAIFALLCLAGIGILHWISRDREKRRWLSPTVIKLYGLVSVAGFAVILAGITADTGVKTAGFTVLGTIAGFLAGTNVPKDPGDSGSQASDPSG